MFPAQKLSVDKKGHLFIAAPNLLKNKDKKVG